MQSKKHPVHNNGRQNGHARDRPSAHPSPSQVQMVSMRMREKNPCAAGENEMTSSSQFPNETKTASSACFTRLLPLERGASNASWRQRASMVRSPFSIFSPKLYIGIYWLCFTATRTGRARRQGGHPRPRHLPWSWGLRRHWTEPWYPSLPNQQAPSWPQQGQRAVM